MGERKKEQEGKKNKGEREGEGGRGEGGTDRPANSKFSPTLMAPSSVL